MITFERVNEAFKLWVKITGQEMKLDYFDSSEHNYDIYDANNRIEGSFKLDPTFKLPLLLLDYHADEYFKTCKCSFSELIHKRDSILAEIGKCNDLLNILHDKELGNIKSDLFEIFKKIQVEYQLSTDSLKIFDEDTHAVTFLYRDSLWAMENLHLYKFTLPEGSGTPTNAPKLVKSIHEFANPTELIDFMSNSVNCIVVGYFPNPKLGFEYSSFAFAFRRGKEIILLTDLKKWDHPLQETMTRRAHPDRHLNNKIGQSHFPYYTLQDITTPPTNDEIKDIAILGTESKFPKTLAYLNQLNPLESYWITFVSSLIRKKFYVDNFIIKKEAATGYSITDQPLMIPSEFGTISDPLDTIHSAVEAGMCGSHPHDQFRWMEKRYGSKIRKDLLFLTKYSEDGLLAPWTESNINLLTSGNKQIINQTIENVIGLKAFNPGRIGTVEELNADRAFLARYNEAKMIEKAACDEFDQTHAEIYEWYRNHVETNMKNLLTAIANLSMKVENGTILYRTDGNENNENPKSGNILNVYDDEKEKSECHNIGAGCTRIEFGTRDDHKHGPLILYQKKEGWYDPCCYLTGTKNPQITATFVVENTNAISAVTGVKFEDLPEVIKNWRKYEHYTGNEILTRVDPMEWAIQDPWRKGIDFTIRIWLSRSAFNWLRKDHGLPSKKFWLEDDKKEQSI